MNLDCLSETQIEKLRFAFRELYALNKWPEDRRSYNNLRRGNREPSNGASPRSPCTSPDASPCLRPSSNTSDPRSRGERSSVPPSPKLLQLLQGQAPEPADPAIVRRAVRRQRRREFP